MKIPLIISYRAVERTGYRLRALGRKILALYPAVKYDLKNIGIESDPEFYALASLASALIIGVIFGVFAFFALTSRSPNATEAAIETIRNISIATGFAMATMFYLFYLFYPGILAKKIVEKADQDLIFALRDLSMQVNSGIALYDAMFNISQSSYGKISEDFDSVVRDISSGTPEVVALQRMALKSKSEYLRKAVFQLITSMNAGAGVGSALQSIVGTLEHNILLSVKKYGANLNFLILIYMLVAAALPSIGITFLILLSVFSGTGISPEIIIAFLAFSIFGQLAIIGYIKNTRPFI